MVEPEFVKADSTNIPKVDVFMVAEFVKIDDRFNAAEIRLVKASLSTRESYGDTAIGYVCLGREASICTVKGKICPEHQVKGKKYSVSLVVNEEEETIQYVTCEHCAASQGRCKHALAFLMWLQRRSEQRSPTEIEWYWNKPLLGTVRTTKKYVEVTELCQEGTSSIDLHDNSTFLQNIIRKAEGKQIGSQISRHNFQLAERKYYLLSLHHLLIRYIKIGGDSAFEFIQFATTEMTQRACSGTEIEIREQCETSLWYELRYGRITASVIHETANCKTKDGSLVKKLLGASKKFDSEAMRRGRHLEKLVIKEIEQVIEKKLKKCGLVLIPQFPILGASPDAIGEDFAVEVKCPSSEKTVAHYKSDGRITAKYYAQIQLQMFATKTKKGVFCIADPYFENNKKIDIVWIPFDENYVLILVN